MSSPYNSHNFKGFEVNFTIFPNSPTTFTFLADPLGYNSPYTFYWDFGDGNSYTTSQLWTQHTYSETGNYTVALTATATIYSGDTISASAPLQIVEANNQKVPRKMENSPPKSSCEEMDGLSQRITHVFNHQLVPRGQENHPPSDIFKDLDLDVDKLTLRLATVLSADPIPGNRKFVKLYVSTGSKKRTVICKNKESSFPDKNPFIGRKVILVTNLAPLSLGGIKSQGLLLEDLGIWNSTHQ